VTEDRAVLLVRLRLRHVLAARLTALVVARRNTIVCGATGAGKTSLLMNQGAPARRLVRP
jgi:Flp pilus assembly CpaF family ATPase